MKGKISQWNDEKGFGFIVSDDGTKKIFFTFPASKLARDGQRLVIMSSMNLLWMPKSAYKP
jgi:cold shock CspA family protein